MAKRGKENLALLKDITERLSSRVKKHNIPEFVEFNVPGGVLFALPMWCEDAIGVGRAYFAKGTTLPKHSHPTTEYLIVYSGSMEITNYDAGGNETDKTIITSGDHIKFQPGEEHSIFALDNVWFLAVLTPSEKGYFDEQ